MNELPDSRHMRRLGRLRQELDDESIRLPDDADTRAAVLVEIDYAMRPPVHERRTPTYASCVMPSPACRWTAFETLPDMVPLDGVDYAYARRFADGRSSLLVVDSTGPTALACFGRDIEREDDLVQLQRDTRAIIVQRAHGLVRIFQQDNIVVWDGVRWQTKPFARVYRDEIRRVAPYADSRTLCEILDFCVHYLSAAQVGATIVWYLDDADVDFMYLWDLEGSLTRKPPELSLNVRPHFPALQSALGQLDGALLVMPDGRAARLGVQLASSDRAKSLVNPYRGTRHTSARRFSFDNDQTLVFVVSEDGPLSVFSDGAVVVGSNGATERADDPVVAGSEGATECADDAAVTRYEQCTRCEKTLEVASRSHDFGDETSQVRCVVCDHVLTVAGADACVTRVRKSSRAGEVAPGTGSRLVI